MTNRNIFTRVYSERSAGKLVSGKGQEVFPFPTLSDTDLCREFRSHAKIWNRNPTALVSGSNRIVDTLNRAFKKHHTDGESKENIWIAFIEVPPDPTTRFHSAQRLAEICKALLGVNYDLSDPCVFSHEVVVEWAIPQNYVVHKVSLKTLVDRGLRHEDFYKSDTQEVQNHIATELQEHGLVEMGLALGFFAKTFGARAPLDWIARQLYYDCIAREVVPGYVDDGIGMALCDWWLLDSKFLLPYEEFKAWPEANIIEDAIVWELVEFWETWYDIDDDGLITVLSAKEKALYERAKDELLAKHVKMRAHIEAEAVRIGL